MQDVLLHAVENFVTLRGYPGQRYERFLRKRNRITHNRYDKQQLCRKSYHSPESGAVFKDMAYTVNLTPV